MILSCYSAGDPSNWYFRRGSISRQGHRFCLPVDEPQYGALVIGAS